MAAVTMAASSLVAFVAAPGVASTTSFSKFSSVRMAPIRLNRRLSVVAMAQPNDTKKDLQQQVSGDSSSWLPCMLYVCSFGFRRFASAVACEFRPGKIQLCRELICVLCLIHEVGMSVVAGNFVYPVRLRWYNDWFVAMKLWIQSCFIWSD